MRHNMPPECYCFNLFSCLFHRTLLATVLPNVVIHRIYIVLRLCVGEYGHWRETWIYRLLARILPSNPQLAPVASLFVFSGIAAYGTSLGTLTRKLYSRIDKPTVQVLELWVRTFLGIHCVFISWRLCGLGRRTGGGGGASSFRKMDLLTVYCVCVEILNSRTHIYISPFCSACLPPLTCVCRSPSGKSPSRSSQFPFPSALQ